MSLRAGVLVLVLAALAAGAVAAPAALANGDPPSQVLRASDVYVPASPASPTLVRALRAAVRRANAAGYSAKVAVVGSTYDLGDLVQAFGRPQEYANYLAGDVRAHPGTPRQFTLLVVMPAGAGIAGRNFSDPERRAARTIAVQSGAGSNALVGAATTTLERMAAAGGHRIGGAGTKGGNGSSGAVIAAVLGALAVLTLVAVLASRARRRAGGPAPDGR